MSYDETSNYRVNLIEKVIDAKIGQITIKKSIYTLGRRLNKGCKVVGDKDTKEQKTLKTP